MNEQIKNLLAEAKANATMIAEQISNFENPTAIAAITAIANNQARMTPQSALKAEQAAQAWIESNEAEAIEIIKRRIAARA